MESDDPPAEDAAFTPESYEDMRQVFETKIKIIDMGLSNSRLFRLDLRRLLAEDAAPPEGSSIEDDLRHQVLVRLDNAILANRQLLVSVLASSANGALWDMGDSRTIPSLPGRAAMLGRVMLPTINWAFLASWFGIYEDGVRSLLMAHGHIPANKGGYRTTGYKLEQAAKNLLPERSDWFNHFGIARRVRNGVHFGGVTRAQHDGDCGTFSYNGHDFVFQDGEPVEIPKIIGTTILASWTPAHWDELAKASLQAAPGRFVPGLPKTLQY